MGWTLNPCLHSWGQLVDATGCEPKNIPPLTSKNLDAHLAGQMKPAVVALLTPPACLGPCSGSRCGVREHSAGGRCRLGRPSRHRRFPVHGAWGPSAGCKARRGGMSQPESFLPVHPSTGRRGPRSVGDRVRSGGDRARPGGGASSADGQHGAGQAPTEALHPTPAVGGMCTLVRARASVGAWVRVIHPRAPLTPPWAVCARASPQCAFVFVLAWQPLAIIDPHS